MILAIIGVVGFGALLSNDQFFDMIFGGGKKKDNRPKVGSVAYSKNDTRHKNLTSFSWNKAEDNQDVLVGDGIFTGADSASKIDLTKGGSVDLGPNTLVYFKEIDGIELPDLSSGNFRLAVNGKMKMAIGGEIAELDGTNSEVQVYLGADKKPQIKLIKGDAGIKLGNKPRDVITARGLASVLAAAPKIVPKQPASVTPPKPVVQAPAPPPAPESKLGAVAAPKNVHYAHQLYDVYEMKDQELFVKSVWASELNQPVQMGWTVEGPAKPVYLQHSVSPNFENAPVIGPIAGTNYELKKVFAGPNSWRISLDQKTWAPASQFVVTQGPYTSAHPELNFSRTSYIIGEGGEPVEIQAKIVSEQPFANFVVERAPTAQFHPEETKVWYMSGRNFRVPTSKVGQYFFRVRGVNEKTQLSAYSSVHKISARNEGPLAAPKLSRENIEQYYGDPAALAWSKPHRAERFEIQFYDANGKVLHEKAQDEQEFALRVRRPGVFAYKVRAVDAKGNYSPFSKLGKVNMKDREPAPVVKQPEPPKPVVEQKPPEPPKEEVRKPSAVSENKMKVEEKPKFEQPNASYPKSKVSLEGATFTMFSREQDAQGAGVPVAMTAALRVQHWYGGEMGRNGVEASLKSKVVSANADGGKTAPMSVEARYARRWFVPFNPFSNIGETQFSLLFGYEMYRNSAAGSLFSPKYDLLKPGFSLEFPVAHNWDTGGEVLYGIGFDQSKKTEISGHLHYYWRRELSMGIGYRVHFFEAGSAASSPLGVPFREGYGEGYSTLRWHY